MLISRVIVSVGKKLHAQNLWVSSSDTSIACPVGTLPHLLKLAGDVCVKEHTYRSEKRPTRYGVLGVSCGGVWSTHSVLHFMMTSHLFIRRASLTMGFLGVSDPSFERLKLENGDSHWYQTSQGCGALLPLPCPVNDLHLTVFELFPVEAKSLTPVISRTV